MTNAGLVISASISCMMRFSGRLRLSLLAPLRVTSSFHSFSRCRFSRSRCLMSSIIMLIGICTQFLPAPVPASRQHIRVASCSTLSIYLKVVLQRCVASGGKMACATAGLYTSGVFDNSSSTSLGRCSGIGGGANLSSSALISVPPSEPTELADLNATASFWEDFSAWALMRITACDIGFELSPYFA